MFLVGDAAHTLPPARGGYGANTGIEDSFNLAWKLASVLAGTSSPALLATYDAERRPIAWLRHDQIFARPDYATWATEEEKKVAILEDVAVELGQLYRSEAVPDASPELPPAMRPEQWAGQPGTRAPHLWLTIGDTRYSTLDLLQRDWVLLSEDERWFAAVAPASERLAISLTFLHIGGTVGTPVSPPTPGAPTLTLDSPIEQIVAEPAGKATVDLESFCRVFRADFGVTSDGASLIRPDGYVAWRSRDLPPDPTAAVLAALGQAACRAR